MLESIEKFENLLRQSEKLNYGDNNLFDATKKETSMLLDHYLAKKKSYKKDLSQIEITNGKDESDKKDNWIEAQSQLINLLKIILEDLKIAEKKKIKSASNGSQIEEYQVEIDRIKNNAEKDLILERNNYNYLKKKYDLLVYNHEKLQKEVEFVFGKKSQWIFFIIAAVLCSLVILLFDQFLSIPWYEEHERKIYLKILGTVFCWVALLNYPLRWDKRIIGLSILTLLILLIFSMLSF